MNMNKRFIYSNRSILFIFLLIVVYARFSSGQTVNVELNHRVYAFIERMETKGLLYSVKDGTKPLTRLEISRCISEILKENRSLEKLTAVEKEQLDFLFYLYREELSALGIKTDGNRIGDEWKKKIKDQLPGYLYKNNRNMFTIRDRNIKIYIDPVLRRDIKVNSVDTLAGDDKINQYTFGGKFWGTWDKYIGFYFNAINTKEWGTRDYPNNYRIAVKRYGYANGYGTHIYHDETSAYLYFNHSIFSAEFGKDENKWGYGYFGNLLLSDYATSYDMLKLQVDFWKLKFTFLHGQLRPYPPLYELYLNDADTYNKRRLPKYLAAHRIEINFSRAVQIGIQEAVVYGGRDLEWTYLNPLMFFRSGEHYLGDQDNALIGFDWKLLLINNIKLYGEFLVDDITISKLNTSWYGNKLGFLGGLLYVDPFNIDDFLLRYEFSRLNHFVYTHTYPINVYKHYSTNLGHRIGPNAVEHIVELDYCYSRRLNFNLSFTSYKHGANPGGTNIGGDINKPHEPGDRDYIGFMEGEIESINRIDFTLRYELLRHLFIRVNMNYFEAGNFLVGGVSREDFNCSGFFISMDLNL